MKFKIRSKTTGEFAESDYKSTEDEQYFIGMDGKVYSYWYIDCGYGDGVGAGFNEEDDLEVVFSEKKGCGKPLGLTKENGEGSIFSIACGDDENYCKDCAKSESNDEDRKREEHNNDLCICGHTRLQHIEYNGQCLHECKCKKFVELKDNGVKNGK